MSEGPADAGQTAFAAVAGPRNVTPVVLNGTYGLMVVPWCPHEDCGWSMPQLWCPVHGNYGMTFLSAKVGTLTHVKAVLGRPIEPLAA